LSYEDQEEDSLTVTPGVQLLYAISTDFGIVVPQISGEYVHEFLNDQQTIHVVSVTDPTVTASYLTEES
jgi:outer membrane lipase/esterase